jgi:hypothetical protein
VYIVESENKASKNVREGKIKHTTTVVGWRLRFLWMKLMKQASKQVSLKYDDMTFL